jgi:osmotically-inducible protein OsmY
MLVAHPIEETARTRLRRKAYLALRHVSCNYQNGVLVLRGRLPSYYLKQVAQEAVGRLAGVDRVENQIRVRIDAGQLIEA